jgi:lipopolysaccharide biosynthesis regulator YciM
MMYDQARAQQPADKGSGAGARRVPGPEPLLPAEERDRVSQRLRQALLDFAETPREALESAESAFDDVTAELAKALAERRRSLRAGWQDQDAQAQAEEFRHALRQYREITERLLRL